MIKIIKKGTRQLATCDKCGCIFSYEEEDIKHFELHNGEYRFCDGTKSGYKNYVICPQCGDNFIVNQTRCISYAESEAEDANSN